jgi:hypothetical protein
MSHDEETHAMSGAARLVRMANQIGIFFESKPHEEGVVGVADHINKFWEPRMRRQFFEMLDAGGEGMRPVSPEDGPHRAPMAERNLPQG